MMKTKMLVGTTWGARPRVGLCQHCERTAPAAGPFVKDKFESRYERTPDQVYAAAVEVIKFNGAVGRESIINPGPNQAQSIEAKVNGRNVWVRVQAVDQKVTAVTVQVRTKAGGTDLDLTQELQKQIAVKLASR